MLPLGLRLSARALHQSSSESTFAVESERADEDLAAERPAKRCRKGTTQEQRYVGTLCEQYRTLVPCPRRVSPLAN